MTHPGQILLVTEDGPGPDHPLAELHRAGWQITRVDDFAAAALLLADAPPQLIVVRDTAEDAQALAFVARYATSFPIIGWLPTDDPVRAQRWLEAGAMDTLICQEVQGHCLPSRVRHALHHWSVVREHRLTVERLRAEQWRLTSIIEGTEIATWEWNVSTGETQFSESWAAMLGYSLAELAPVSIATWHRLVHPEDLVESNRRLAIHFAGDSPHYEFECRMRHRRGHWIWVHDRGKVISRGPDGAPELMFGTHADITERKHAEAHVQESLLLHRLVVQTAMDGFCIVDQHARFLEANDAYCRLTGYSALELRQLRLTDLEAEATPVQVEAQLSRIRTRGSDRFETRHRRRDGTLVDLDVSMQFLSQQGGVFVSFLRDISERKQIAAHLLRRKQELNEVQELARIGSWRTKIGPEGEQWLASAELQKLLGYPSHQALPDDGLRARLSAAERSVFDARWAEVRQGREPVSWTHELVDTGTVRWVQLCARATRDLQSGIVTEITGTLQDITTQVEISRDLERHTARLRHAEKIAGIGHFEFSFATATLSLSEGAKSILPITALEPSVADLLTIFSAADRVRWQEALEQLVQHGRPIDLQVTLPSPVTKPPAVVQITAGFDQATRTVFGVVNDLTERHDLLNHLRENAYFLEKSQRFANIGSFRFDIQRDHWIASAHLETIFGIDASCPRRAADWIALVAPSHRDELGRYLQEDVILEGNRFDRDYPIVRPSDQQTRWLRGAGELEYDAAGQPAFMIGTIQDITESRQAAEALRLSEERFRTILQSIHFVAVQGYAPDGTTQYWNRASEVLYGYTAEEALGRNLCDLIIPPAGVPAVRAAIKQMADTGVPIPASELALRRKDGSPISVFSSHAIIQQPGHPQELFCVDVDLTELRRAEDRIRLQATALDASANAILITDRDGTIEWANAAFTGISGYSVAEAIGQNPRDLVHSHQHDDAFYADMWATITAGEVWRGELINRRKDGSLYTEEMTITPLWDEQGEVCRFIAVMQDVTQRKALEVQFRQAQKMDAIGRLAGGVAHDFNNILAAVLLHLGLLQEEPNLDEETKSSLLELTHEIKRGAALTRQLLTFSRKEAMQCRPVEVSELVQSLVKMVRRLLPESVTVRLELDDPLPTLNADPGMIEQVLVNLCINARDAMPQGGLLTLRADSQHLHPAENGHSDLPAATYLRLQVIDTGEGMPPDLLQRIFEPFFTTKDVGRGTGLGLSTAYGIVKQHAGWLDVESTVGVGSTFKVFLPVPAQPFATAPTTETLTTTHPVGHDDLILLLEDEDGLRRSLTKTLERHHYQVLAAAEGATALQLWQEHHPRIALLITDLVLPNGISGIDVIQRCQGERPDLPVIACSGYRQVSLPESERLRILQKPFDSSTLLRTMRNLLDRP